MGFAGRHGLVLAASLLCRFSWVAAVLSGGALGLHRVRLVLAIGLLMGLGSVSLWALASSRTLRLGLVSGSGMGAGVGDVAREQRSLWLGTLATWLGVCGRPGLASPRRVL